MSAFAALPKFVVVGFANTILALSLIFIAKAAFGFGDATANAIGYGIALTSSFALNRRWTFRHAGASTHSLPVFIVVQLVAYISNLFCVLAMIRHGVDEYWAQVLGIPPYTVISFLGSRFLVFPDESAERNN